MAKKYELGTKVEYKGSGVIKLKTDRGLRPEARVVAEQLILHRELEPDERVYHRDCNDMRDNSVGNLVVLRFRSQGWRPVPKTNVIYVPVKRRVVA